MTSSNTRLLWSNFSISPAFLTLHHHQSGPYFRDQIPVGTFLSQYSPYLFFQKGPSVWSILWQLDLNCDPIFKLRGPCKFRWQCFWKSRSSFILKKGAFQRIYLFSPKPSIQWDTFWNIVKQEYYPCLGQMYLEDNVWKLWQKYNDITIYSAKQIYLFIQNIKLGMA